MQLTGYGDGGLRGRSRYVVSPTVRRSNNGDLEAVPARAREAVAYFADVLHDQFYRPAIETSTTPEEFRAFWRERWHEFTETLSAQHAAFARALTEERALRQAIDAMEASIERLLGGTVELAGEARRGEVEFALFTVRSAMRLVVRFLVMSPPGDVIRDRALAAAFFERTAEQAIAVQSLHLAIDGCAVAPSVLDYLFTLLREAALSSYELAREAVALREQPEEPGLLFAAPDEEDAALADEDFDESDRISRATE
jgi:hypothetical protein